MLGNLKKIGTSTQPEVAVVVHAVEVVHDA